MRIRKRQLPLPFSSLSSQSQSQSDPLPPVQLPCAALHGGDPTPPPPLHNSASEKKLLMTLEEDDGDEEESREISRVFGAETSHGAVPEQSTSSPQGVVGEWCEREKAFPLKKRRGSFEKCSSTSSPPPPPPQQKQEPDQESKLGRPDLTVAAAGGKKRSRGGALMEGSRCSRVNGRGWRCCQQTLVGYSLCEHHLGKGRLRSINTVRRRSLKEPLPPPLPPPLTVASKKRVKLGMVKARSMSSLLGQTDNVRAAPPYPLPLPLPHDNDV